MSKGYISIICGPSGSGKTTALLHLLQRLSTTNLDCRGILCPPVFHNGEKTGIDLMNVSTGEKFRLAEQNLTEKTKLATHGWKLKAQAVRKGNQVLESAIPCDILFVDELGPLEFERAEGLLQGFSAISSQAYAMAFVSIRPSLLHAALDRWPGAGVFQTDQYAQNALISKLLTLVDLS